VLRSRVAIAERERSQLADRLQELEYRNAANLTKISSLAEELHNCQKSAESRDGAKMKEEIQSANEEEKRNLVEELNRLRHSEESLKREVEGAQRKFQYLSEDYQKNQEAKDALEESNDNLQSRFNKLQREKNELQTQVKRLLQEKEEGGIQLKKAIEENEETTRREESRLLQALDQLSQLKGEKIALETDKSGLVERVKKLEAEHETKTHEERSKHEYSANIRHLEEKLQEFGSQNTQLEHLLKEEQSKSHLLQDDFKKNHEELQSIQSTTLKQHQIKERALEERVAELEFALNTPKESHHDTVSLRQALDQTHKAAEAEKETASRLSKQNNEDRAKIQELVKVNAGLKKQIKELNSTKQSQTEVEELKKRLRDEMVSHSGTLQQLEDSQKTFQESNEIIEKLTSDITRLQDSSAPLKREIDSLKAKNAQLTRVLAEEREAWKLEQIRQEQMKQAHDEQMQTAALESLRKEYEEIQKEAREEINSKTRALQTEREAHERTKQQLTEVTQSYERERNVIPDLRNQLKEALDMNEHSKKQTESSSRELQDSYAKLSNELQEEQKVLSSTKAQVKQLSATIIALQVNLTKAKTDNGELISNLHRLEQSLEESLNLHNEEQRSSSAQISQKSAQVLELTQQLLDFEKENSHLQEEVRQFKADVATLTEGHRQLENEARTQTDKREAEKRVDQDTIRQLRETLTQHKQQDESTLRQLEVELSELKQELARERDSHQATKVSGRHKDSFLNFSLFLLTFLYSFPILTGTVGEGKNRYGTHNDRESSRTNQPPSRTVRFSRSY
jgi:chromosome segregation ATPase